MIAWHRPSASDLTVRDCNHLIIPSLSPPYHLAITGWQSGTSSVRPTRSTINTPSCREQSGVCSRCRVSHHQRSRRVDLMRRAPRQEPALATRRVTTLQTSPHGRPSSRRSSTTIRGSGTARTSGRRHRSVWHNGKGGNRLVSNAALRLRVLKGADRVPNAEPSLIESRG